MQAFHLRSQMQTDRLEHVNTLHTSCCTVVYKKGCFSVVQSKEKGAALLIVCNW